MKLNTNLNRVFAKPKIKVKKVKKCVCGFVAPFGKDKCPACGERLRGDSIF